MSGAWEGSRRRDGLPRWWPVTVRRILERDPYCKCPGCPKCLFWKPVGITKQTCHRASQECDHIGDSEDHRDSNLRGICKACHGYRSSQQGNEARRRLREPTGFLADQHPGDVWS